MIPLFPSFKPLELADRRPIARITRRFEPYSDFSFGSLWCWDVAGTCRISSLHGNLVVRFRDYSSDAHAYGFLGDREVLATARTLLAYARAEGLPPALRLMPEVVITDDERLSSAFVVTPDPANFDYVCAVHEWVGLAGSRFARHRTRIRRCQRRHGLAARPLSLTDPGMRAGVLALFERWAAAPRTGGIDRQHEHAALRRLFQGDAARGMHAWGLFDGITLRAFSIWEYAPLRRTSVHHFMKADPACADASLLMIHARSQALLQAGYAFANIEQDLGIPGLAAFKQFQRPCRFLRKFVIAEDAAAVAGEGEVGA